MKTSSPEALIRDLIDNARMSGQHPLEKRLAELTIWFYNNKHDIPPENLPRKVAFLEKAFWIMLEVMALEIERQRESKGSTNLWLPSGMVSEDGKRFS